MTDGKPLKEVTPVQANLKYTIKRENTNWVESDVGTENYIGFHFLYI